MSYAWFPDLGTVRAKLGYLKSCECSNRLMMRQALESILYSFSSILTYKIFFSSLPTLVLQWEKNIPPNFFNGAFAPSLQWCRRPWSLLNEHHWLYIPDHIQFLLATLPYFSLPGNHAAVQQILDYIESRRRLGTASTAALALPHAFRGTIEDQAFTLCLEN